jgi:hypothetical protein
VDTSCTPRIVATPFASLIFSSIFIRGPLRRPGYVPRDRPLSPRFPYRIFIGRSSPSTAPGDIKHDADRASALSLSGIPQSPRQSITSAVFVVPFEAGMAISRATCDPALTKRARTSVRSSRAALWHVTIFQFESPSLSCCCFRFCP